MQKCYSRTERSNQNSERKEQTVKNTELKLICELMKNGRRSDRELAKAIGVSQPTVTRTRIKLEKEGIIKEYTVIPDFSKLGFEIMAVTFIRFVRELSGEELGELRGFSREIEKKNPEAVLIAAEGMGLGFNRILISFHRNYSSYMKVISFVKMQAHHIDPSHIESFIISLTNELHYQPLTLSIIANYLLRTKEEKS
jgi:DNA-binding Lrp family transcriptional regulator